MNTSHKANGAPTRVHRVHSTGIAMPALKKATGRDREGQGGLPPVAFRQSSTRLAAVGAGWCPPKDKDDACQKGKGWNTECHRGFFVNVKAT
jgi:hypothetical protein